MKAFSIIVGGMIVGAGYLILFCVNSIRNWFK
jgi:hypothetical protein